MSSTWNSSCAASIARSVTCEPGCSGARCASSGSGTSICRQWVRELGDDERRGAPSLSSASNQKHSAVGAAADTTCTAVSKALASPVIGSSPNRQRHTTAGRVTYSHADGKAEAEAEAEADAPCWRRSVPTRPGSSSRSGPG